MIRSRGRRLVGRGGSTLAAEPGAPRHACRLAMGLGPAGQHRHLPSGDAGGSERHGHFTTMRSFSPPLPGGVTAFGLVDQLPRWTLPDRPRLRRLRFDGIPDDLCPSGWPSGPVPGSWCVLPKIGRGDTAARRGRRSGVGRCRNGRRRSRSRCARTRSCVAPYPSRFNGCTRYLPGCESSHRQTALVR
jgi:hypothetical protein